MSLEAKIEDLTKAVHLLVAALGARPAAAPAAAPVAAQAPAPVAAPVAVAPVPVPVMPPPPVFVAPPPPAPVAPAAAPFSDQKGLIDYVMGAYKALGPQKGAQIQNVLIGMGCTNINDVKPEQYGALYAAVEALK
jgi:hypothetical protein